MKKFMVIEAKAFFPRKISLFEEDINGAIADGWEIISSGCIIYPDGPCHWAHLVLDEKGSVK